MKTSAEPSALAAIKNGFKKRCPRCGDGALFSGFVRFNERCAACGLQFEPEPGSTWAFLLIGDRVFLFTMIVLIYFGYRTQSWLERLAFLAIVALPLVLTLPNRQGAALAVDYLTRRG